MAQYMSDILEPEDREKLHENLLVGASKLPMEVRYFIFATTYMYIYTIHIPYIVCACTCCTVFQEILC